MRDHRAADHDREPTLTSAERRVAVILGVPTLLLALVVTLVTTYLPVVASDFVGSTVVIGVIVGLEGVVALWLPLVAGSWSDRLRTRLGGRVPFLIAATPLVLIGLVALGVVGSVGPLCAAALVFFTGYFLAYEPYRALYPDAIGDEAAGRAQGTQAVWRGAGTGLALVGGGLLLALGRAAPFLAGALIFVTGMAVFAVALARRGIPDQQRSDDDDTLRDAVRDVLRLVRGERALQAFLVANGLWELSLAALKTFVVLYVTEGLGYSRATAALMIGGVIMALPYAILMPLMPADEHGALTGYYSFGRGLGTWLGPLCGGVAITIFAGLFTATQGYQAVWGVCAAATLLSLIPLRALARER